MARTIRRKHYVPNWATEESVEFTDSVTGRTIHTGWTQLQGEERRKRLRWWHSETTCFLVSPRKVFRKQYEARHRMDCKREMSRYLKDCRYEIMLLPKKPLGYWL